MFIFIYINSVLDNIRTASLLQNETRAYSEQTAQHTISRQILYARYANTLGTRCDVCHVHPCSNIVDCVAGLSPDFHICTPQRTTAYCRRVCSSQAHCSVVAEQRSIIICQCSFVFASHVNRYVPCVCGVFEQMNQIQQHPHTICR